MIPDKIYIPIIEEDGKKLIYTNWWETDARSRYVNETITYIRKDVILALIESRLSEIIGDAQPKPDLRAELEELINKIKK
jgi:hypothetical protein